VEIHHDTLSAPESMSLKTRDGNWKAFSWNTPRCEIAWASDSSLVVMASIGWLK